MATTYAAKRWEIQRLMGNFLGLTAIAREGLDFNGQADSVEVHDPKGNPPAVQAGVPPPGTILDPVVNQTNGFPQDWTRYAGGAAKTQYLG